MRNDFSCDTHPDKITKIIIIIVFLTLLIIRILQGVSYLETGGKNIRGNMAFSQ